MVKAKSGEQTLADRVRWLVDRFSGGSVHAAARLVGLHQQTLQRIVTGEVRNPRADALQALATGYGASLDWLLTGAGEAPQLRIAGSPVEDPEVAGGLLRLDRALDALGFGPEHVLGQALRAMSELWCLVYVAGRYGKREDSAPGHEEFDPWMRAAGAVAQGWATALEEITAAYGVERARRGLQAQADALVGLDPAFLPAMRREGELPARPVEMYRAYIEKTWAGAWADAERIAKEDAAAAAESATEPAKTRKRRHA